MTIPVELKIGGLRYKVKIIDEDSISEKACAEVSQIHQYIKILEGNIPFMHQALWHEIFHAMNMEIEEEKVEWLAQAIYQIIVDNPKLFESEVRKNAKRK